MDGKLIYLFYRAVQWTASPFIVVYFLFRGLKDPRYFRRFGQRLGFLPHHYRQTVPGAIWLHAVSVGEVLSSIVLIRRLRDRLPVAPETIIGNYGELINGFIYDQRDSIANINHLRLAAFDTLMDKNEKRIGLAQQLLAWISDWK